MFRTMRKLFDRQAARPPRLPPRSPPAEMPDGRRVSWEEVRAALTILGVDYGFTWGAAADLASREWWEGTLPIARLRSSAPWSKEQALTYTKLDPAEMPPIFVLRQGGEYDPMEGERAPTYLEVFDGEHRVYATRKMKLPRIPAYLGIRRED